MADLTVTQLLLETPAEHERGIINGVQNSLNKLMDIIKFLLVIFLPWPQTFGYLIIVSFAFICVGFVLFSVYACQARDKDELRGKIPEATQKPNCMLAEDGLIDSGRTLGSENGQKGRTSESKMKDNAMDNAMQDKSLESNRKDEVLQS